MGSMASRQFDPTQLLDDQSGEWSFDHNPVYEVLVRISTDRVTGVCSCGAGKQVDRLFFREGTPVGVSLAENYATLGELLLEHGDIDAAIYQQTKQYIEPEKRLPGQVYVEMGAIDDARLKQMLQIQAVRKALRFVERCKGRFEFSRGLSFLSGFVPAIIGMDPLVMHALNLGWPAAEREAHLHAYAGKQVCATRSLSQPMEEFGFGQAEERFLALLKDWRTVDELYRVGTLPKPQIALLVRYFELHNALKLRPAPAPLTPEPVPDTTSPMAPLPPLAAHAPEKTERISVPVHGWSDPRPTRNERGDTPTVPSVIVDYAALGIGPEDVEIN